MPRQSLIPCQTRSIGLFYSLFFASQRACACSYMLNTKTHLLHDDCDDVYDDDCDNDCDDDGSIDDLGVLLVLPFMPLHNAPPDLDWRHPDLNDNGIRSEYF